MTLVPVSRGQRCFQLPGSQQRGVLQSQELRVLEICSGVASRQKLNPWCWELGNTGLIFFSWLAGYKTICKASQCSRISSDQGFALGNVFLF